MKSTEFLREEVDSEYIMDMYSTFAETIRRDCQPYLQEAQPFREGRNLMRGMGEASKKFIKNKSIRLDDRTPKDIPKELHNKINQYFKKKFGGEFRNALFATGDYMQAENYGNVYYIFPIGDFKYLYNPGIEDLFMNYDEYAPYFRPGQNKTPVQERNRLRQAAMDNFFDEEIAQGRWMNTNLDNGIQSGMEIMIRAKGFHAVSLVALEHEPELFFEMLK